MTEFEDEKGEIHDIDIDQEVGIGTCPICNGNVVQLGPELDASCESCNEEYEYL